MLQKYNNSQLKCGINELLIKIRNFLVKNLLVKFNYDQLSYEKCMNRSKFVGATALASVMAAGAAHAEMSIGGFTYGHISDAGGGQSQTLSTNSLYVSYSDSLDNGMGVSSAMSIYAGTI